jgi:hypothetical protein
MAVDTWRRWNLCAATVARLFLAAVLLLSASTTVFQFTLRAELAFSLELLLGAAIAIGWLMRYPRRSHVQIRRVNCSADVG